MCIRDRENSSSPTTAPVSPTLKPGRRYLSVIAHVSGENVQRLEEWKRAVAGGAVAPISTHVTVYLTELNEMCIRDRPGMPRFFILSTWDIRVGTSAVEHPYCGQSYL